MKSHVSALCLGLGLSTVSPPPAAAYPVDCAILLCLAGGWPASAECVHARAVFIRRITPWPIEPPLQIWNCPMRAALRSGRPVAQVLAARAPAPGAATAGTAPVPMMSPLPVAGRADIDISGAAFEFVRSIRVFEITFRQESAREGVCNTSSAVVLGSYGPQGEYSRRQARIVDLPAASDFEMPALCQSYRYRAVFVDWRDVEGRYGHEEVRY